MKDSDKDGISDKYDDCPSDFGVENFNGRPDSVGVLNKNDRCPNIKGSKSLSGYPDGGLMMSMMWVTIVLMRGVVKRSKDVQAQIMAE